MYKEVSPPAIKIYIIPPPFEVSGMARDFDTGRHEDVDPHLAHSAQRQTFAPDDNYLPPPPPTISVCTP